MCRKPLSQAEVHRGKREYQSTPQKAKRGVGKPKDLFDDDGVTVFGHFQTL